MEPATTITKTTQVFLRNIPELRLHRDQIRVVNVLRGQSKNDSMDSMDTLTAKIKQEGKEEDVEKILQYIADTAPIIIHVSVISLEKLLTDTHYRSTFETNTKGDGYLASRIQWESACFLKLYDGVKPFERPKYGALNFLNNPRGVPSAKGYGELYFELKDSVRKRVTLATGDTGAARTLGVLDFCAHVLTHLTPDEISDLVKIVNNEIPFSKRNGTYREIQIHGEIQLNQDIKSLNVPKKMLTDRVVVKFGEVFGIQVIGFD